jgi:hypothetical protein
MERDYLLGNFERCLTSMKRLLSSNERNLSLLHNISLVEWYVNHEIDITFISFIGLLARKERDKVDHQHLIFSFNVCVLYYLSGQCNQALEIVASLMDNWSDSSLVLKFAVLLSEVLFSMIRSGNSKVIPIDWNTVTKCLANYIKVTQTNSPEIRNYLTFRLHLLNCRFCIMMNQLKAAKKEIKMAMEMYHHQMKNFDLPTFAELLNQFHYDLPSNSLTGLESAININREMDKEGCLVHFLKVIPLPLSLCLALLIKVTYIFRHILSFEKITL